MIWIKLEKENFVVTEYYLRTIEVAFKLLNEETKIIYDVKDAKLQSGDTIVISTAIDVLKVCLKNNVKIIFWAQGAWPEESYMRNSSRIRTSIASKIEKKALKRADFCFFVSESMKKHYENKYKLQFENYYIMPCSNEDFHPESFDNTNKYKNNVFCYAGAISVWQCFEETIKLYADIETKYPESKLLLLVKDANIAEQLVKKYKIVNYEIDYVSVEALQERLRNVKFGFILRQPSVVNTVATPTKNLTYISNGIIPIYSDCLYGIEEIMANCQYKVKLENNNDISAIEKVMKFSINNKEIKKEYRNIFIRSYSRDEHSAKISKIFKDKLYIA